MADIDRSHFGGQGGEPDGGGEYDLSVEGWIHRLIEDQLYGVLCTQSDGQPYGSMVAFAFSEDLKHVVFGTPRATKKYQILAACRNVALVVNNMSRHSNDLMKVEAFTATGRASEITQTGIPSQWVQSLLKRHPNLEAFVLSSSTAIFEISIARFFLVRSFQKVTEWTPPSGIV
ncbi:MAG: pyridoxamine 5'-phosphate oxidase family protein [candidate division Zixibacteria bacterium]|nr:pyridoxamine 5'-phosphate oxidase family protein [candidate division Zixibacteria bacterium]